MINDYDDEELLKELNCKKTVIVAGGGVEKCWDYSVEVPSGTCRQHR